ncbi:hypothetical protein Btru_026645 [Bulinus truncatus]|nr:hypothetical protein Btru_026645 [Bulinus truncatus]
MVITCHSVSPPATPVESPLNPESKTVPVSSASAHLSPLPLQPAVETQENQLAKKLSQYLENGVERETPEQKTYVASKNLTQTQTSGLLPKVDNTLRDKPGVPVSRGHANGFISSPEKETNIEHQLHKSQTSLNEWKSVVESHSEDFLSIQSSQQDINKPGNVPQILSGSPREIFARKTLDSVGFLPCQNMPDVHRSQSTTVPGASEKMISKQEGFENKAPLSSRDTIGFSELNFQDSVHKNNGLSSLNLSLTPSEDLFHNKCSSLPVVLNYSGDTPMIFPKVNGVLKQEVTTTLQGLQVTDETSSPQNTADNSSQVGTLEHNDLIKQSNDNSSNDSSEFQDLLSSMSMPSLLVNNNPTDTSVTLAAHTLPSSQSNVSDTQTYWRHDENLPDMNKSVSVHRTLRDFSSSCSDNLLSIKSHTVSPIVAVTGLPNVSTPSVNLVTRQTRQSTIQLPALPISQTENYIADKLDSHSHNIEFTCLENLKYDFLIRESKNNTPESTQEALLLRHRFDDIKLILSNGNIQVWEEYKTCVEGELSSLIKQIESLMLQQKFTEMKILRDKKRIAEREGTDGRAVTRSTVDLKVPGSISGEDQGNFSGLGSSSRYISRGASMAIALSAMVGMKEGHHKTVPLVVYRI